MWVFVFRYKQQKLRTIPKVRDVEQPIKQCMQRKQDSHSFIMPMSTQRLRRQAWQCLRLSLVMVQLPLKGQVKLAFRFILRLSRAKTPSNDYIMPFTYTTIKLGTNKSLSNDCYQSTDHWSITSSLLMLLCIKPKKK